MKKVFVDTNVVLDVLLQRSPFWQDSLRIFQFAELGEIEAYVSASSMTDIFYVANKKLSTPVARQAIEGLFSLFRIVGVDGDDLRSALHIPINDFEDALQAHCAFKIGANVLLTRDIGGFVDIDMEVVTPEEFNLWS